jgi:hypothetical protein
MARIDSCKTSHVNWCNTSANTSPKSTREEVMRAPPSPSNTPCYVGAIRLSPGSTPVRHSTPPLFHTMFQYHSSDISSNHYSTSYHRISRPFGPFPVICTVVLIRLLERIKFATNATSVSDWLQKTLQYALFQREPPNISDAHCASRATTLPK